MEPQKLGRYEIVAALGRGAMGTVYRANDPMLHRTVAIKTINIFLDADELAEYEARFYQEAKAAGGLNHPNIVTVYDIGKEGTVAYMAMEFLEGNELRKLVPSGTPLPVPQALDIAAQVADGLAYAHEHQVVHRDIKPANIMITKTGLAKIMDFGIARMRASEVRTQTGVLLGSPKYLSPEQVMGKRADHRSDLFSLGVVLYEILTGTKPFGGDDLNAIMFQILNHHPRAPSLVNPEVPEILNFVVAKALAKAPEGRYQNAKDMANDLRECRKYIESDAQPNMSIAVDSVPQGLDIELVDTSASLDKTVPEFPAERKNEDSPVVTEPPVALGLAKAFDNFEATVRLATATGAAGNLEDFIHTQKMRRPATAAATAAAQEPAPTRPAREPAPQAKGWSGRDLAIISAAVVMAIIIGAIIVTS